MPPPAQQNTQGEDFLDFLTLPLDDGLWDSLDLEAEEAHLAREPSGCSGNPPRGFTLDESLFIRGPQATVEGVADGTSLVCSIKQDMNMRTKQIIKLAVLLFFAKLLVWDTLDVIGFDHVMLFYRLIIERLYLISGERPSEIAVVVLSFLLRTFSFLIDALSLSTVLVGVKLKNPNVFGGRRALLISVAFYVWTILLFVAALVYGASRCWQLLSLSWQGDVPQLSSCNKLELEEGFAENFDEFDQALKDEDTVYWSEELVPWENKKGGKKRRGGKESDGMRSGPHDDGKPKGHKDGKRSLFQADKNSQKGLFEVDCEVWSESIPLSANTQLAVEFLSLALSLAFSFGYVNLVHCIRHFLRRLNVVHPLYVGEKNTAQEGLLHVNKPFSAQQLLPKEASSES
eukprot:gene14583-17233_t